MRSTPMALDHDCVESERGLLWRSGWQHGPRRLALSISSGPRVATDNELISHFQRSGVKKHRRY